MSKTSIFTTTVARLCRVSAGRDRDPVPPLDAEGFLDDAAVEAYSATGRLAHWFPRRHWSSFEQHANNPIEADHSRLKHRLRPMRGLRTDTTAQVNIAGHAFMQNLRRGHHELVVDAPPLRVTAAFTELAQAI